jgi:hypothetical protein
MKPLPQTWIVSLSRCNTWKYKVLYARWHRQRDKHFNDQMLAIVEVQQINCQTGKHSRYFMTLSILSKTLFALNVKTLFVTSKAKPERERDNLFEAQVAQ